MAGVEKPSRNARKCAEISRILLKEEVRAQVRKIAAILKISPDKRTVEESQLLEQSADIASDIQKRAKIRDRNKQRQLEVEDSESVLREKCSQLAEAIKNVKSMVIYSGAGISTAASIPDYRGPNGVWTLLQQGIQPKAQDLSEALPTVTHMTIAKLFQEGLVTHVVSQNCDGLHLRSGLPRHSLSEVHGNMYIEKCAKCPPPNEYIRLFDITERTGVRKHKTGRICQKCGTELNDTIVHFGEKGEHDSPYNWKAAAEAAENADIILCLGSSLKVLKKYPSLWCMNRPPAKRPKLYIVNLQWTPKDDSAVLKINGQCDRVMKYVIDELKMKVDEYKSTLDPIYYLATALQNSEMNSFAKNILETPSNYQVETVKQMLETIDRQKSAILKNKTGVKRKMSEGSDNSNSSLAVQGRPGRKTKKNSTKQSLKNSGRAGKLGTADPGQTNGVDAIHDGIPNGTDAMNMKRERVKHDSTKSDCKTLFLPTEKPFGTNYKVNCWLMSQPSDPLPVSQEPEMTTSDVTTSVHSESVAQTSQHTPTTLTTAISSGALALTQTYPCIVSALQGTTYTPMSLQSQHMLPVTLNQTASSMQNILPLSLGFPMGFMHNYAHPISWQNQAYIPSHLHSVVSYTSPDLHLLSSNSQEPMKKRDKPLRLIGESQDMPVQSTSGEGFSIPHSVMPLGTNSATSHLASELTMYPAENVHNPIVCENSSRALTQSHMKDMVINGIHSEQKYTNPATMPGWFGKGLNVRKNYRRKKSK